MFLDNLLALINYYHSPRIFKKLLKIGFDNKKFINAQKFFISDKLFYIK